MTIEAPQQATTGSAPAEQLLEMYRRMRRIRRFEERASELYKATEIPGFLHLSIGQEASAVGACWPLGERDGITSTHRGHGHVLAKGLDAASMMAELMGREAGTCHGRGGSMHIADPGLGIYGANGIVGAGLPIAAGVATAAKLRAAGDVVVAFFGDGAVAQGMFHEAVNLAAVWDLPVVFLCENNHYSEFSPEADQHRAPLSARAAGYGIDYEHVDGNDVLAVSRTMTEVVGRLRAGGGPILVEAETYRWHGHYEGDPERYRTPEEVASAKERDPLLVARRHLAAAGVATALADAVDEEIDKEIEAAVEWARALPEPAPESLYDFVSAPRTVIPEPAPAQGEVFRSMDAVRLALEHELAADPSVFVAGIDVGAGGNVFGLTRGLADAFPGRVRDTPISESAILGTAVGAAMAGMRPVVEIMYMDFIGVALDMLLNQAAKLRFMTGGRASMPLVVRTQFGAGRSSGSQHSQSLEALLAHIPGLTVVMPSNPADTYGLLRAAIRDPNPVVFVENRLQYGLKGPRPPADHLIPLGKAKVIREGTDITLVSWSRMVQDALAAAELLAGEGISVEVIDLRTIAPLDRETVLASLAKTNRLVIAHEAVRDFGVGAELSALAVDEGFWHLDAPVTRVAPPPVPAPYAPSLERVWLPSRDTIADTVRRIAAV
ncbi:alpha-ketoacid dehydrogenase subunit alpha/beta [Streptomyces fulvoviolaceus]|uniref:alpha-ketoacid dehydrogenase subunit alpha/beta n=1 Tax=Streptomyces fulvoviolaceus TaxID=285535 RepID=UPI0004C5D997|nr:dehydrogenase E1 component subunit alpha/beta [Streptomyces fulvoviolaceus]MCT9084772.1 dehydrogenase E1 component subunit alpha/beta [Streptomyces fulvoviolaceus]